VQAHVLSIQQRIAALTGRSVAGASADPSTNSTTFASTLAQAQADLTGGTSSSTGATGASIVADATQYLGVPYKWGGTDPATGLDCSGLVQRVLADNGITVPRTAAQQATVGTAVPSLAQAQPGDLIVLDGGSHIGIYVGGGKMLHAPKTGDVVKVSTIWETPTTIRRVVPDTTSSTGTLSSYLRSAVLGSGSTSAAALSTASTASTGSTSTGAAAYQSLFAAATAKYHLPAGLLSAVASTESGYDPDAVSPAGAQGLMQLMPGTAADLGVDALDPRQAVDGAARLLSKDLSTFGSVPLALAAYNAGPGNVTKYGGIPPFAETQAYVRKVTAAMNGNA
jgi:cell wall-associated NlpC family hydrolase